MKNLAPIPFALGAMLTVLLGLLAAASAAAPPQTSLPGHDGCANPLQPPVIFEAEGAFENVSFGDEEFINVDNPQITGPGGLELDLLNWDIYVTHWSCVREDDPDALNPRLTLRSWWANGSIDPLIWGYMANRGPGTQGWNAGTFGIPVKGNRLQMKVTGSVSNEPDITWKIIGYAYPKN